MEIIHVVFCIWIRLHDYHSLLSIDVVIKYVTTDQTVQLTLFDILTKIPDELY